MPSDNTIENKKAAFFEYIEMSMKGLYSFNSFNIYLKYGDYHRVSCPDTPLNTRDLPMFIQKILQKTKIYNVRFDRSKTIEKVNIMNN